jgi:cytochrome c5
MDLLYQHAIEGFTGAKGQMPARGGSTTLSDEDVKATVDFMVDQSR